MITTLIKNEKYSSPSCTSLTSFSRPSSFSKNSTSYFWGRKRYKKELRSICLKPRKCYPLPLPKSVPHLPKVFFTEHLLVNCVFSDESETDWGQSTEVDKKEKQESVIDNEKTVVHETPIFRSGKLPLSKPKIPAPDFKLRESRRLLTNRFVENVLLCQRKSKPRIESINILINCRSDEDIYRKRNTNRSKLKRFNCNKIEINESINSLHKNNWDNINRSLISNETGEDFLVSKSIQKENTLFKSINPSLYNKNENLLDSNSEVCHKEKSQFVFKKPAGNNHLAFCEVKSVYCCNNLFDKNRRDQQSIESEDLESKFLALPSNKETYCSSATKIIQKVGFTLTFTKRVLNEQLFNVYSCIVNKIEGYILQFQPRSITECCNCVTKTTNGMFQTLTRKPKFQVDFSAHTYNTDVTVLQAANNNFVEMSENNYSGNSSYTMKTPNTQKKETHSSGHVDRMNSSSQSKSENKVMDKANCICNCSCKGKAAKCQWKLFHHSNISESLFFGPTLDEAIFNLICCTRQILEKLGLISSTDKESKQSYEDKLISGTQDDCSDNSLDVVKWLHDEYLNLAKDVAEANNVAEHNCPCTKDNCPVILQSRRFVLDRLAELLEKKQEIERAYRKKEKHKNI